MTTLMQPDWLLPLLAAPFVGSFLSLLIARLPAGSAVVFGRSACLACRHPLGAADLVPVLSWLVSRGRCRHCGAAIGALYPLVELAALGLVLWAAAVVSGWILWATCALGWSLLALAVIDWRHQILPDHLTLTLAAGGLVVALALGLDGVLDHVIGLVAGFLALALVRLAYQALRGREGLGLGDAKLAAAAGAWVSWSGLASVVLVAALAALVVTLGRAVAGASLSADTRLPFGPYLALGTWLVWLYGPLDFAGWGS